MSELSPKDILPFLCQMTGKCCIHNLVILSPFDVFRMAKFLNRSAKDLFRERLLSYRINTHTGWMEPIIRNMDTNYCPFLTKEEEKYVCGLYESRPVVCRIYPLKYDSEVDKYFRFIPSEMRCKECTSFEHRSTLDEYLDRQNIPDLIEEYKLYLKLLEELDRLEFSVTKIKGNKPKQKVFFDIQALLYETHPAGSPDEQDSYPFEIVEQKIRELID